MSRLLIYIRFALWFTLTGCENQANSPAEDSTGGSFDTAFADELALTITGCVSVRKHS